MATFTLSKNGTDYTSDSLGIQLLKKSRRPMLPRVQNRRSVIPGKHGYYDYGADLRETRFQLRCFFKDATSQATLRTDGKDLATVLLSAETGRPEEVELSFSDSPGLSWFVVYSGEILPKMLGPHHAEFVLRLSAYEPFAREPEDTTEDTVTTSPGEVSVTNSGNVPTPARYLVTNTGAGTISGFTIRREKEV